MPTVNLGRRELKALRPTPGRATTFYDAKLKGFGVRFHKSGRAAYIVEYRPLGSGRDAPKKRITIAALDAMKLEAARDAAKNMLAGIRLGADPMAERQASRRAETVADLFAAYLKEHVRPKLKPGTAALYAGYDKHWIGPAWGTRKAESITRADVQRLQRQVAERREKAPAKKVGRGCPPLGGKGVANRLLAFVSGAYRWGSESGILPEGFPNPARGVKKFAGQARERFLSSEEFARLGEALRLAQDEGLPWHPDPTKPKANRAAKEENRRVVFDGYSVAAIRLLILTGARLREILNLKWSEVDFERGLLFLGDSKTGPKPIVLSPPALEVLAGLERVGAFVIASGDTEKPKTDLHKPWARISKHAGLEGVRLHDLRHTYASVGVGGGLNLPVIGKLLGHKNTSTTQKYAHLSDDPVRAGANAIANRIAAMMGGTSGEVVRIHGSSGE